MFDMKSIEEELNFIKSKLQTLSIYIDEPKSKEIVKQLQDHNDMMLAGIEQQRLEAIKFNKEHGMDFKHLER